MGRLKEIVFDCEQPARLARFWAMVLEGFGVRAYNAAEVTRLAKLGLTPETDPTVMVDGPDFTLCFQKVPGRKYDNNRVHLDVAVADRHTETARLLALGATVKREADGYTVMGDPEGNQFCLVDRV